MSSPDGHTVQWDRRANPLTPGPGPAPGPGVTGGPGPGTAGPGSSTPGSAVPFVPPEQLSGESTQYWKRERQLPPLGRGPAAEKERSHTKLFVAVGGAAAVVAAIVVVLLVLGSSSHPRTVPNTITPPVSPQPNSLAPVGLTVINESGTSATLRWTDPSNGRYPFVVQVVGTGTPVRTATSSTQTVVAGLDPLKGYCFAVGALYGYGTPAYAAPVCIRGATATPTTAPTTTTPRTTATTKAKPKG